MLTRIYIDNFRCFQNFEYKPERKHLLLGPNGSGKSSLLEALRLIKTFVKGDPNHISLSSRTRWLDSTTQVFEVEAVLDKRIFAYRLEIGYEGAAKQQEVRLERLTVNGSTAVELADGKIRFFSNSAEAVALPLQTSRSVLQFSLLSNKDVRRFVEWLTDHVHCFDVDPYPGQMDEDAEKEEREPDFELNNLAAWYRYLLTTHPVENVKFMQSLNECMEGFYALSFSSQKDGVRKLRAEFASPSSKKVSNSISELSEGQRCLISLYMILRFSIEQGDTVFIDEPDNFIALREIQPWLLSADEAVDEHDGQLILVSHHPETLNQWAGLYGIRFFREQNGQVRTEKFAPGEVNLTPAERIARGWE